MGRGNQPQSRLTSGPPRTLVLIFMDRLRVSGWMGTTQPQPRPPPPTESVGPPRTLVLIFMGCLRGVEWFGWERLRVETRCRHSAAAAPAAAGRVLGQRTTANLGLDLHEWLLLDRNDRVCDQPQLRPPSLLVSGPPRTLVLICIAGSSLGLGTRPVAAARSRPGSTESAAASAAAAAATGIDRNATTTANLGLDLHIELLSLVVVDPCE